MATKKTKKWPGPGPIPPAFKEQQAELVKSGLKKAAKVIVPMAAAAVAMFKRKPEDRLEARGERQLNRADRKSARAASMQNTRPVRAAKLAAKASRLRSKAASNIEASEEIKKSKQQSPVYRGLKNAAMSQMPKNLSDLNKGKKDTKIKGGLNKMK